jgi:hypothetical protein
VGWINVTQDRDKWQALVNTVRNLHISTNAGMSRLAKEVLVS